MAMGGSDEDSHYIHSDGYDHYNDTDINAARLAFSITCFTLMPVHITINLLVLISIYVFKSMHTNQNILRASASLNGLLAGLLLNPIYGLVWLPKEYYFHLDRSTKFACLSSFATVKLVGAGALTNMTAISADRFFAVVYPIKYRNVMSSRKAWLITIAIWTYGLIFSLSTYVWNHYEPGGCESSSNHSTLSIHILGFPVYVLCLLMSTVFNGVVLFKAFKFKKHRRAMTGNSSASSILLHLSYLIFVVPYLVAIPLKQQGSTTKSVLIFHTIAAAFSNLYYSSSPLVYIFVRKQARAAVRSILTTPPWRWSGLNKSAFVVEELKTRTPVRTVNNTRNNTPSFMSVSEVSEESNPADTDMSPFHLALPSLTPGSDGLVDRRPSTSGGNTMISLKFQNVSVSDTDRTKLQTSPFWLALPTLMPVYEDSIPPPEDPLKLHQPTAVSDANKRKDRQSLEARESGTTRLHNPTSDRKSIADKLHVRVSNKYCNAKSKESLVDVPPNKESQQSVAASYRRISIGQTKTIENSANRSSNRKHKTMHSISTDRSSF